MEGYTTVKQSKELLELGLPANSADCYYLDLGLGDYSEEPKFGNVPDGELPCWTFHRLLNIILWQDYYMKFFGCPMQEPMEYVYDFLSGKLRENNFKRFSGDLNWEV